MSHSLIPDMTGESWAALQQVCSCIDLQLQGELTVAEEVTNSFNNYKAIILSAALNALNGKYGEEIRIHV